jgi:hypothetical protein
MKKLALSLVALSAISGVALAEDSSSALRNSFDNGYPRTEAGASASTDSMAFAVPGDAVVSTSDYARVKAMGSDIRTERGAN